MNDHKTHSSSFSPAFPRTRMRRNRRDPWSRRLVAETRLAVDDLIWPIFIQEGHGIATEIESTPWVKRLSLDLLIEAVHEAAALGIPAVALFPATPFELKTPDGDEATNPDNLICRSVRAIKALNLDIG